eukprot:g4387.t1
MKQADLIIKPEWVVPVVPEAAVYTNCALAVLDGRIEAILPVDEITSNFQAKSTIDLPGQALLPGLVNAHGHAAMTLLRGYADDLALNTWLTEHIWPAESQHVSDEFVRDGTRIACAEMIRTGTTCFSDMYFFPDVAADVANQAGLRSRIAFPVLDFPSAWAQSAEEYVHKGLALHDQYKNHPLVSIAFGPHAPYTVGQSTLERIAVLAEELDAAIHIHLHETRQEVEDSLQEHGLRPTKRMEQLGILGPRTEAVHMTQWDDGDLEIIQKTNTSVIHCPKSNLKLASGFCPTAELLKADIRLGLGTDGAASNNCLNMLEEMRFASLLGKATAEDPTALSATQTLYMATMGGAQAMGLDREIGSLEPGKLADMISIRVDDLQSQPVYNLISQIVYAAPSQALNMNPLRADYINENSPVSGLRYLDVGCGGGILTESMAEKGAVATGIDMGEAPLSVAKLHALETGVEIDYRQITAEALANEKPESFDVVSCMEMLEHVPDPALTVQACADLAKPGGTLYFSTISRTAKAFAFAIVGAEYVLNILPRGTHEYKKFIRPSELATAIRQAGLVLEDSKGVLYNPLKGSFKMSETDLDVNYMSDFEQYRDYQPTADMLEGRVIFVTGAGDGIGKVASIRYAECGATVILAGRTVAKLEAVYDEIISAGCPEPVIYPIDLTGATEDDYAQLAELIEEQFGKLDGLLHNAGVLGARRAIANYLLSDWDQCMNVNVRAQFLLTHALVDLIEALEEIIEDHNADLEIEGVVINQFQARARIPQAAVDDLKKAGYPVLAPYLSASSELNGLPPKPDFSSSNLVDIERFSMLGDEIFKQDVRFFQYGGDFFT